MIMHGTTPRALTWSGFLAVLFVAAVLLPVLPTWAQEPPRAVADVDNHGLVVVADEQESQADVQRLRAEVEQARASLAQAQANLKRAMDRLASAQDKKGGSEEVIVIIRGKDGEMRQIKVPDGVRQDLQKLIRIAPADGRGPDAVYRFQPVEPRSSTPAPPTMRPAMPGGMGPAAAPERHMQDLERRLDGLMRELENIRREMRGTRERGPVETRSRIALPAVEPGLPPVSRPARNRDMDWPDNVPATPAAPGHSPTPPPVRNVDGPRDVPPLPSTPAPPPDTVPTSPTVR